MEHPEGADYVECRRCGERTSLTKYEQRASILARAYGGPARLAAVRTVPADHELGPVVWWDGTVHERPPARSNMMLTYLARHDGDAA